MVDLIGSRQRDDGGFVELDPLRHSGTNPTAAAVGVLRLAGDMDAPPRSRIASFLAGMQNAEGGLRANGRIPLADLLSTFTGLVALADLEAVSTVDLAAARRYVEALQEPDGGFRGGVWDDAADVEVVKSPSELLSRAAADAVSQWRYQPALDSDGNPIAIDYTVTLRFALR